MIPFDVWLLDRFQRFAEWWQKLTGKDCFFLARLMIACHMLHMATIGLFVLIFTEKSPFDHMPAILISTVWLYIIRVLETEARSDISRGCRNRGYIDFIAFRLVVIIANPLILGGTLKIYFGLELPFAFALFSSLCFVWYIPFAYFLSCTPLPPAKSKIREWIESFSASLREFVVHSPVPAPVRVPS